MARIEETILQNLFASEKYCRTVVPFLKPEYFADVVDRHLITEFIKFFSTHNQPATPDILSIELRNKIGVSDAEVEQADTILSEMTGEVTNHEWIVEKTEEFCKKRSVYLAIMASIAIMDGADDTRKEDAIPKILEEALAISFDVQVGHDYLNDAEQRYDEYVNVEDRIPFGLEDLDKISEGGMARKALYCVAAQSGGGKSIFMTHTAAQVMKSGKNVLYITLEMSETKISQRVDANLMNVDVGALKRMSREEYLGKIARIRENTPGKLFVKEYPTGGAHSGHFRGLIEELRTKQNFHPDLIIVDYLGICASARMRMGGAVNTYSFQKAIAEELRGLAVEFNVPVLTAQQLNRSGYNNSDVDMSNTADSLAVAMTLDFYFALVSTPELEELDQVLVQILKNRTGEMRKFVLGLIKRKMQFYTVEKSAQNTLTPKVPAVIRDAPPSTKSLFDRSGEHRIDGSQFNFGN